ncbi:uncharacterized protein LOC124796090 [Schistocerca piceifrons]|uniref:uncharacterized protein LOC124796090 n=1 Tax=Schistocerca piceifrons TaxID=274613 RepID=UPI001F5F912B|nr:uncharacterized protein LOC124796090 [Schistocerca piceifrons]
MLCATVVSVDKFLYKRPMPDYEFTAARLQRGVLRVIISIAGIGGYTLWVTLGQTYFDMLILSYFVNLVRNTVTLQFYNLNIALRRRFRKLNQYLLQIFSINAEDEFPQTLSFRLNCPSRYNVTQNREECFLASDTEYLSVNRQISSIDAAQHSVGLARNVENIALLRKLRDALCLLCDLVTAVNVAHSKQNLLELVSWFFSIVSHLYMTIVVFLDLKPLWHDTSRGCTVLMWSGVNTWRIVSVTCSSDAVIQQAERMGQLVYKLLLLLLPQGGDSGCREELQLFSQQLSQRKLNYSAARFVSLNTSLLKDFVGAVTTYVIIYVQFSLSDANQQQNITGECQY